MEKKFPEPSKFIRPEEQIALYFSDTWSEQQKDNCDAILQQYYIERRPVKEILTDWGFNVPASRFTSTLPTIETYYECQLDSCNGSLLFTPVGRDRIWSNEPIVCEVCNHKIIFSQDCKTYGHYSQCDCDHCENKRAAALQEKHQKKEDARQAFFAQVNRSAVKLADLSPENQIKLAAAIRCMLDNDTGELVVQNGLVPGNRLMQRTENVTTVLRQLHGVGALCLISTRLEGDWKKNEYIVSDYQVEYSRFLINLTEIDARDVGQLAKLEDQILQEYSQENEELNQSNVASLLSGEAMLDELISYSEWRCDELGLPFHVSDVSLSKFKKVLNLYDLGRARNIVWSATRGVLEYQAKNRAYRKQLAGMTASFTLSNAERAKANEWELEPYLRTQKLSEFSKIIANVVTGLGDAWETTVTKS